MLKTFIYIIIFLTGIIFWVAGLDNITAKTGFCISCHSMKEFHFLSTQSPHVKNRERLINCTECHVTTDVTKKYTYKLKSGIKDTYKTLFSGPINLQHFNGKSEIRHEFVFNDACLKCHIAGIQRNGLKKEIVDIHKYIMEDINTKMNCVDCHGGMEHGREPVFNWKKTKEFIYTNTSEYEKEKQILENTIHRSCIACHLKGGVTYGKLEAFGLITQPADYLALKVGIKFYDMPPSSSLKEIAHDNLNKLEHLIEK